MTLRLLSSVLAILAMDPSAASAQAPRTAVLLEPRLHGERVDGVGHALARVARETLRRHAVVELGATPALGLEDLKLAVGCVADSAECFGAIAAQLAVEELVLLDVERAGEELVATISIYEAGASELRTATRRTRGESADGEALDQIDPMIRELYGLPDPDPAPEPDLPVAPIVERRSPVGFVGDLPAAPIALLAAGAVTFASGLTLGAVSQGSTAEANARTVDTSADVDAVLGLYERAEREALAANVLIPIGAALAAAGVVWWIAGVLEGGEVSVTPAAGPAGGGVIVAGRFGGER